MNKRPIAVNHWHWHCFFIPWFCFKVRTRSGWLAFERDRKIRVSWSGCFFAFHFLTNSDYKESLKYTKQKQHVTVICSLHNVIAYLFSFVMLLCINKFLNVIIEYIFCFYPYTNVNQPNPEISSTMCTCFRNAINRGNRLSIFLINSKW